MNKPEVRSMIQCFSFSMHAFQDDVLRINYTKTIIEKGKEALECIEHQEFDFTEFWFDDTLSADEGLPEHLRLQRKEDFTDTQEPFHSYTVGLDRYFLTDSNRYRY